MTGVFGKAAAGAGVPQGSDAASAQPRRPDRPNILFIMADQLAAPFLPIYGHRVVQAPNLDQLAETAAVFTSAYCNSPLCAPSRFSMMSGQLNSTIGAYDNASEFPSSIPTFAHYLRGAGYRTILAGKMHFVGADQLHGFEERTTTDIYPADFGWTPDWDNADERIDWWYHNMDSVRNAGVAEATNQLDYDDDVSFTAVRKLRDLARATDDRPWMMTVSFTHPHDPYVARREHWDRYDHDEIDMPVVTRASGIASDPHSARLRHVSDMDSEPITDEQVRNARHAYYASISYVDDQVGKLVRTLKSTGMDQNTVIVFTADHGDMLGERDLWYKMSFFEHASRVPLLIAEPGRTESVRISDHVSLLDLLPTFADMGGASIPDALSADLAGDSLVPKLDGQREPNRTVVGEYLGEGAVAPIFMIRRGALKYIWSEPDPPQLYDLEQDPHETVNVAGDPAWAHVEELFRAEIDHRWNPRELRDQVVANQRARQVVDTAMRSGRYTGWDFQPSVDATNTYMRNHLDLNEVESSRRL